MSSHMMEVGEVKRPLGEQVDSTDVFVSNVLKQALVDLCLACDGLCSKILGDEMYPG